MNRATVGLAALVLLDSAVAGAQPLWQQVVGPSSLSGAGFGDAENSGSGALAEHAGNI